MRPHAALLALLLPLSTAAAPVALVLQEDPPLPGEPLTGWEALGRPPAPEGALDLDGAVAIALANNPELRALQADVDAARGAWVAAGAWPNPTWELELYAHDGGRAELGVFGAGAELDVTDLLLAPVRASAAAPEVEAARLRREAGGVALRYQVRAAWYDHQAARAAWDASLRSVDALAAARDAAQARVGAGDAQVRDLVVREAAYAQARLRAAALEVAVVTTREGLARLLGGPPGPLAPGLAPAPATLAFPDDLEGAAVAASRELRALDAQRRAGAREVAAIRLAGLAPDVDLIVATERRGSDWGATAGLGVSVPMFAFGRGDALRASGALDRLGAERDRAEIDVRSSAREARVRLESAWRRARHHEDVLIPARERALHETLLLYNAMQVGIDVLLDAWRARVEAEIALADTRRELWTAQAAVDALLAGARVDAGRAAASETVSNEPGGH